MADKIVIGAEVRGNARSALRNLESSFKKFSTTTERSLSRSNQVFNSFLGNLSANIATRALSELGNVARRTFDVFITQGVEAAQRQENAINGLNSALARQGTLTPEVSQEIQDFASELQRTTTVGDETALELFSLSAAFTDNVDKAKLATQAAIELSEVADISLVEATRRVGRAFQGSTEDISKFAPEIRNLTKEQLAAGEAARILVERLGGTAASRLLTFSGVVAQAGNSFGDLQETIGFGITQNRVVIQVINQVSQIFQELTGSIGENNEEFDRFVGETLSAAIQALGITLKVVDGVAVAFNTLGVAIGSTIAAVASGDFSLIGEEIEKSFSPTFVGRFADSILQVSESADETLRTAAEGGESLRNSYSAATVAAQNLTAAQIQLQNEAQKIIKQQQDAAVTETERLELQLETLREAKEQELILEQEFQEAKLLIQERIREKNEELALKEIEDLISRNEQLQQINDEFAQREIRQNQAKIETLVQDENISAQKRLEIERKLAAGKDRIRQQELSAVGNFFGALSDAAALGNEKAFKAAKAFAIVEATIAGFLAVQKALASAPPPFNFIQAAAVGVATGVNIAKIASQQPPGFQQGIDSVPGVGFSDNFSATLAPGERVVPRRTNEDLTQFLQEQSGVKQLLQSINNKIGALQNGVRVDIGGETIIDTINRELDAGRVLRV